MIEYMTKPPRRPRWRWVLLVCLVVLLVPALVIGINAVELRQQRDAPAGATVSPSPTPTPSPSPSPTPVPIPDPDAACLSAAINAVQPTATGTLTGKAIGLQSQQVLWDVNSTQPMTPASNEKLLTVMSLITALGPNALVTTYKTSVVAGDGDKIVLVGGGDPYLASNGSTATLGQPQTLDDLAAATATALQATGRTSVSLGFDDTAFSGPDWHPSWAGALADSVTRISALWVDEGMSPSPATTQQGMAFRSKTAAYSAAKVFASQLQAHGIQVTGVDSTGAVAPAGQTLASIDSMPLGEIIDYTLQMSDNSAAEVLLRHLAITTGAPGTFDAGAAAVMSWLNAANLAEPGINIVDGSGLSSQDAVPTATLLGVITWAVQHGGAPQQIVAGLPVSGYSGTLSDRFNGTATAARGFVHAKTGYLDGFAASLTGYAVTAKGQEVAFSVIINGPGGFNATRTWLDNVAAAIVTSGC